MKKFLSLILALVMLTGILSACSASENNKNKDENNDKPKEDNIDYLDVSGYTIVRSAASGDTVRNMTSVLKKSISDNVKLDLAVAMDDETEVECEILVGETNRKESVDALVELKGKIKKEGYVIKVVGSKIVILGHTEDYTALGVKQFINAFVSKSTKEKCLYLEKGDTTKFGKNGEVLYVSETGSVVVLDKKSTVFTTDNYGDTHARSYAKIIKLEHQPDEKNNGILLATNEFASPSPWPMYRSKDDGDTWENLKSIPDLVNGWFAGYQPYLFELPEDVGEYKKGTILFAACTYNGSQTAIIMLCSTDLGETWKSLGNVTLGGPNGNGVWEPVISYEDGRVYCFYSDEQDNFHNQRLIYKYTTDLKKWSEIGDMVTSGPNRPGMVALTKMGNGKWALAFEYWTSGQAGYPVRIMFADKLDSWKSISAGTPVVSTTGVALESGPAMTWTPAGGGDGVLFLCAYKNINSKTDSRCDLFMSFDYGKTFVSIENPLAVMKDAKHKCSYSPGFYTDKDGAVYYVNNPALVKGLNAGRVDMAKIMVY